MEYDDTAATTWGAYFQQAYFQQAQEAWKIHQSMSITNPWANYIWRVGTTGPLPKETEPYYTPTPILAWRSLIFDADRQSFSGHFSGNWDYGLLEAQCRSGNHHGMPGWSCNCGIYAHHEPEKGSSNIYTLTALSGVIEHELGYRARRAWVVGVTLGDERYRIRDWDSEDGRRIRMLVENTWAVKPFVARTLTKLERVKDYLEKNPEKIPVPVEAAWTLPLATNRREEDPF